MNILNKNVIELKLKKPQEFTPDQKIDFLMSYVFGDKKIKGIVQAIDGIWEENKETNQKVCKEQGLKQALDSLMITVFGGEQIIGEKEKNNKVKYEGAVDKINQLFTFTSELAMKMSAMEKMILAIACFAKVEPKNLAELMSSSLAGDTLMWNNEFNSELKAIAEERQKEQDKLNKVEELKKDKRVKKLINEK